MRIAFLGLGNMGRPMARNLLGLGHELTVYNRTPGKARPLLALGAKEAFTVPDAVRSAEIVITMLPGSAEVAAVVHGPAGLLEHMPSKSIHLCMCTIAVETSALLAAAHAKAGQGFVAAPVFGRADAVAARQIWIMAGGPESQVNRCLPIFVALGRGLTRVGPKAPLAHALKLGGDALTVAMEKALAEVVASCEKAGMAPGDYVRYLNMEIFKSPLVDAFGGVLVQPTLDPADLSLDVTANELLLDHSLSRGEDRASAAKDGRTPRQKASVARSWREQAFAPAPPEPRREGLQAEAHPPASLPAPAQSASLEPNLQEPETSPTPAALPPAPIQPAADPPRVMPVQASEDPVLPEPGLLVEPPASPPTGPGPLFASNAYPAMDGENRVTLLLSQTSHFEVIDGRVRAWSDGRPYATSWHTLDEVEKAFRQVMFLAIQRNVLLRPEATLELRATFGGGAKARVAEQQELPVRRAAVPRLKELLGI